MATHLKFQHQCPQCGAPVLLDETERLLSCPYCRVRLFLHYRDTPRVYLPPVVAPKGGHLVYLPYWRFRGMGFSVTVDHVSWRVLDQSALAVEPSGFPGSLGLRPQALMLKALQPQTGGAFYPPSLKRKDFIAQLARGFEQRQAEEGARPLHQAFVGESVHLIYAPFLLERSRVRDAITGAELPLRLDPQLKTAAENAKDGSGAIDFLPTLCPHCGWDLAGEADSLVLFCRNCDRIWHATHRGLQRIQPLGLPTSADAGLWIPFWVVEVAAADLDLTSYGDFVRLTNQTRLPNAQQAREPFRFLVPACKLNPKLFLHLGSWMTLQQTQKRPQPLNPLPQQALHPVNLAPVEGFQSVLALLAELTVAKKKLLPKLKNARLAFKSYRLLFVPFRSKGIEYIQPDLGFSVPCSALRWGRCL